MGHTPQRRYGTLGSSSDGVALASVVRGLARPARARLTVARSTLATSATADEAWESAITHGLIPSSWIDDPARRFVREMDAPAQAHPPHRDAVVAVASDLPSMLTVELFLRELAARLSPYDVPPLRAVHWHFVPSLTNRTLHGLDSLYDRVFASWPAGANFRRNVDLRTPFRRARGKPKSLDGLVSALDRCGRAYGRWEAAAAAPRAVAPEPRQPGSAPNPFTPLLRVFELGYLPVLLDDGVAKVIVPPL